MKTEFSTCRECLYPKDTNRHSFLGPLSKVDPKHSWDNPWPWGDKTFLRYRNYVPPPHNLWWISRTKPLRFLFSFFFFVVFSVIHLPCCCSVTKSCPTLCDPMDCSMPGFPVLHYLPDSEQFTQTHVHWVGDAIPSTVTPFSSCPQSFPTSGSFPMSLFQSRYMDIMSLC